MLSAITRRPRNVNVARAAGILYGDWGTSKAYVIGLAFAMNGYSSFWLIAAVSLFSVIVALNYITICKYYPNGGGVYASVRHRSQVLSLVGAFFLIADYSVTGAISALSAFQYLGIGDPVLFAALAIGLIGFLNFFGPKHTGNLAFGIGILTIIVLFILLVLAIPHLKVGIAHVQPLKGSFWENWKGFIGVIVALSGIEAIANATGVMRLDKGSTYEKPSVKKTSTPAILWVMIEVAVVTTLFSLALSSISGLSAVDGKVLDSDSHEIRDYILKYLGQVFATQAFGAHIGTLFATLISIVIGILLLSAVNTAIIGLISIQYLMSTDGELPPPFAKLNSYGVPFIPQILATFVPILLVTAFKDISSLADLYAIGFVGAIATNLGSTSTDPQLDLKRGERIMMFGTFLVMAFIDVTLFIDKPHARNYVLAITVIGLILRSLSKEASERKLKKTENQAVPSQYISRTKHSILCAVHRDGKSIPYALEQARIHRCPVFFLYLRRQKVLAEADTHRHWEGDPDAANLFHYIQDQAGDQALVHFEYVVTDSAANTIVQLAKQWEINHLIIGLPKKNTLITHWFKGNLIREIIKLLPKDIDLIIIP